MKHEIKKLSKMIDEVATYFMRNYECFDIDISIRQSDGDFTLRFLMNNIDISQKEVDDLRNRLTLERRPEVEDYYWQLTGQTEDSSQLRLIAMMCDEAEVSYTNRSLLLRLRRVIRKPSNT